MKRSVALCALAVSVALPAVGCSHTPAPTKTALGTPIATKKSAWKTVTVPEAKLQFALPATGMQHHVTSNAIADWIKPKQGQKPVTGTAQTWTTMLSTTGSVTVATLNLPQSDPSEPLNAMAAPLKQVPNHTYKTSSGLIAGVPYMQGNATYTVGQQTTTTIVRFFWITPTYLVRVMYSDIAPNTAHTDVYFNKVIATIKRME